MAVFAVIPTSQPTAALDQRILGVIPKGDALRLPLGEWLIAYNGTSKELSDALGISEAQTIPGGVVISITSYFGRATTDVWEFFQTKLK